MVLLFGILFVLSVQPMMVISSMIFSVLMYSMFLYWGLSSFWFSYMMVLVLMSGVLVVFTYMLSVLPNEMFEMSSLVLLVFGIVMIYEKMEFQEFIQDVSLSSVNIWWGMLFVSSMFLVIYLLIMMVMVVWLSMMECGAIRIF